MGTLKIKRNTVAGTVPAAGALVLGELALNTEDGYLYAEKNDGLTVQRIGTSADRVTHDGGTVKTALDTVKSITSYAALRAYNGTATQVRVTNPGIEGFFYYDAADTASVDNGGTIIVAGTKRWKRHYSEAVNVDWFEADPTGIANSWTAIKKTLDYAIPLSLSIIGTGKYATNQPILIPKYRTSPIVPLDFTAIDFALNQLTYTGSTGEAVLVESPASRVYIKKLIGPGGSTTTSGLAIAGEGDSGHRVDYVTSFGTNVHVSAGQGQTVWIGYCQDADIGVLIDDSNSTRLYAGRIGGQSTPGSTEFDPTTCGVGVRVQGGMSNEIHATIEYCKRDANSIGLHDSGTATRYVGRTEGNALWNIYADGYGGQYHAVTRTNGGPSGVYLKNDNKLFLAQQQTEQEVPVASSNQTLEFETPSKFVSEGFSTITGEQGYVHQYDYSVSTLRNKILNSHSLVEPWWEQTTTGSANWNNVGVNPDYPTFFSAGYLGGTRLVFPALPNNDDIYYVKQDGVQSGLVVAAGPVCYGLWIKVESGDVDVQVRIIEESNGVQSRQVVRLGASDKWVNVAAKYMKTGLTDIVSFEVQFRTKVGATVYIANTYIVATENTFFPPQNRDSTVQSNLMYGIPVNGNMFENGLVVNGMVRNQYSPTVTDSASLLNPYLNHPIVIINGGTGNKTLQPSYSGHRVVIKRNGDPATGALTITPNGTTIDGSSAAIDISAQYFVLELIYSPNYGWLKMK